MREFMPRFVNLEKGDYWIVKRAAEERGLGLKGFSAALRLIIREWQAAQSAAQPAEPEHASDPEASAGCTFLKRAS